MKKSIPIDVLNDFVTSLGYRPEDVLKFKATAEVVILTVRAYGENGKTPVRSNGRILYETKVVQVARPKVNNVYRDNKELVES